MQVWLAQHQGTYSLSTCHRNFLVAFVAPPRPAPRVEAPGQSDRNSIATSSAPPSLSPSSHSHPRSSSIRRLRARTSAIILAEEIRILGKAPDPAACREPALCSVLYFFGFANLHPLLDSRCARTARPLPNEAPISHSHPGSLSTLAPTH